VGFALSLQLACSQPQNESASQDVVGASVQSKSASSKNIETCFSPSEQCDLQIIKFIKSAGKSLDIAIYAITHPDIATAIKEAHHKGIQVRMVVDRTQAAGVASLVDDLKNSGVPLKIGDTPGRAIMHNKFTIVDGVALETGSYNYTKNASDKNSENQIYLHDSKIIEVYQKDFDSLWANGLQPDAIRATGAESESPATATADF
jgi:phosphatidylserine/phosphatidylglycerophosphate/cardiolipin synthase-like enzyme